MKFELNGKYLEKGNWKKFSRIIEANSDKLAREKAFCLFGSEHKVQRRHIKIDSVKEYKEAK